MCSTPVGRDFLRRVVGERVDDGHSKSQVAVRRRFWSAPRRMKGDRVAIGITSNEEATKGAISEGAEDRAAPLDNEVVQRVGVGARDPEHHAHTERPRFWKRMQRFSKRQRNRLGLENDRSGRTVSRGFETEDLDVEFAGCGEVAHLQGDEVGADWRCHGCHTSFFQVISVP